MSQPRWAVVVPVKRLAAAKSRLRGALPGVPHEELALALAADTLRAVLACPAVAEVRVVTDDARVAAVARATGARVLADEPDSGLNAAFRHGAAAGPAGWVAGLTADLPALRPAELAAALLAAEKPAAESPGPLLAAESPGPLLAAQTGRDGVRRFVPDAPGGGTVLLTAAPGVALDPRFGVGSAAAHAASGALPLTGDWPSLRRDVDTAADLSAAARLGLGPRTAALLDAGCPAASAS
ncbi:NTP transferase domain-containing protein [Micromonospora sp. WMMD710]|uniref:NTP transferase domain-containing protein n=1 Tax=Micromonospora sp. WMMD710 TaxID=3016085 RepID=UPI00241812C1|nr:NTP transferase domain-containing protein [Micromonospora sp. WMMD710]MDG4759630.1 2-phospho-L-lactate guanylyltransferase [Micromonospora sp. WMMD710]